MCCPHCGARTEVNEKRGPFRDRQCTNAACRLDFTTHELVLTTRQRRGFCARTRATQYAAPPRSPAAAVGLRSFPAVAAPGGLRKREPAQQEEQPGLHKVAA